MCETSPQTGGPTKLIPPALYQMRLGWCLSIAQTSVQTFGKSINEKLMRALQPWVWCTCFNTMSKPTDSNQKIQCNKRSNTSEDAKCDLTCQCYQSQVFFDYVKSILKPAKVQMESKSCELSLHC